MLRIVLVISILLISSACFCQQLATTFEDMPQSDSKSLGTNVTDYVVSPEASKPTKYLAELYKRALVRERLGAYENALGALSAVNSKAVEILNSKDTSRSLAAEVLPYAIASAYRKGILTHRAVEGSVMKLYKQLELYEDADTWINEVLTSISNLTTEKGMDISPAQYYPLYYAKSYNRLGWAYALLNGSAWKRYVIYTPADTIAMVDKSMGDLGLALKAFDIDYADIGGSRGAMEERADRHLSKLDTSSDEYVTYALCFNIYKMASVRGIVKKQLANAIKDTLDKYYSSAMVTAFNNGRKIFTYEEFMKPETKEIVAAMAGLLDEMK
jgi:tetratricopeptide (TPR) repeat protein